MMHSNRLQFAPAAAGFILSSSLLFVSSLQAAEFKLGDSGATATLNTTISVGTKYDLKGYESPSSNEQNENDGYRVF